MDNQLTPYHWEGIDLTESVLIDSVPHFTRRAVGEWLEYEHSQKSVDKILERNSHIKNYSTTVNMTAVDGKKRDVLVYHPMGFLLLVMESSQPKAIKMKEAVAAFVYTFAFDTERQQASVSEKIRLRTQMLKIADTMKKEKDAFVHQILFYQLREVCELLGQPVPSIQLLNEDRFQKRLDGV